MNNDLIRRSDLKAAVDDICYSWGEETEVEGFVLIALVDKLPAVDAVEVVRCKDCMHRGIVTECPMCYTEDSYDEDYGYDYWDVDKTVDEGFCHCGEVDAEVEG